MEAEKKVEPITEKQSGTQSRAQSTIEFPYLDMENSVGIAGGVHEVGGSSCEWDQLAAHFKQAAQGGGFRLRLICAKIFGLVTYDRGRVSLTTLGLRVVDAQQQRTAKIESFLTVPLYKAVYDKFRGTTLPPNPALEHEMIVLGVAPKQADKARQAFQRSAKYAGFFDFGNDRLVIPKNGSPAAQEQGKTGDQQSDADSGGSAGRGGAGGGSGVELDLDPLLIALLQKIPPQGEEWPQDRRLRWFKTFAMNVSEVYDLGDKAVELSITVAPETGGRHEKSDSA